MIFKRYSCLKMVIGMFLWLLGNNLIAQDDLSISYSFKHQPLHVALQQLEQNYGLTFAYDNSLVDPIIIEQVQQTQVSLDTALEHLLTPHQLGFEILNEQFILIKRLEHTEKSTTPIKEYQPSICGYILDSLSQTHLAYANIAVLGSSKGVYSNNKGYFRLYGPFAVSDTIQISYLGYKDQRIAASELLRKKCKSFELVFAEFTIDPILIKEKTIELLRSDNKGTGLQFDTDRMGMVPGWGDNDVLRMTQLLPGVRSSGESASDLHIRGGTPDQNLILWEGIPIYHTGHLFGMISTINPSTVDEVSVLRGGFGTRYGERVSGIIDLKGTLSTQDSLEMGAGLNLINGQIYLKTPLLRGKSALLVAFRRSYTDLIQSETYKKLFNQLAGNGKIQDHQREAEQRDLNLQTNTLFHFSDANLKWIFQPRPETKVDFSFYSGKDRLDYGVNLDLRSYDFYFKNTDAIRLNNWGISSAWEEQWNPKLKSKLRLNYSQFRYYYQNAFTGDRMVDYQARGTLSNAMKDLGIVQENHWDFKPNQQLEFGYQFTSKWVDLNYINEQPDTTTRFDEHFKGNLHSLYFDYHYKLPEQFSLDFGLRFNKFQAIPFHHWEPRLAFDIHLNNTLHLKGSVGRYMQYVRRLIQYNELGLGEELWIMANQKHGLPPVSATQYSMGLWLDKKGFLIDLDFYKKHIQSLTSFNLTFSDRQEKPFDIGTARIQGMDLLLKKKWKKYTQWLAYSLGSIRYQFSNINATLPFPATHDQLHTINWTHLISFKKWECSLSWNYGSGRPYTDADRIDIDEDTGRSQIVYANPNTRRLPSYHRLDFSTHYQWQQEGLSGKIGLSIFNLYNQRNIFDKKFFNLQQNDTQLPELIEIDRQMLGLTPNLFLELKW